MTKIIFAKDVPTYRAQDSHTLRNLDQGMQKHLRFELETTPDNLLNLAIYDQQDPANSLYLVSLNRAAFDMIQNQQNLVIEQFSMLPSHLTKLFDHCIQSSHYFCAIKTIPTAEDEEDEEDQTISCTIYQQSDLSHLRHISLNLMQASDSQARHWLARKQQVAWAMLNQTTLANDTLQRKVQKAEQ